MSSVTTGLNGSIREDSYVFKLKYSNGTRDETRRYGFKGDLSKLQVYEGLHTRTSQVFKLNKDLLYLLWQDNFNRTIKLINYTTFLEEVVEPLNQLYSNGQHDSIKRDLKGRIELIFNVGLNLIPTPTPTSTSISTVPEFRNFATTSKYNTIDTTSLAPVKETLENIKQREESQRIRTRIELEQQQQLRSTSSSFQPAIIGTSSNNTTNKLVKDSNEIYIGVKNIFNKFIQDLNGHLIENLGGTNCQPFNYTLPDVLTLPTAATEVEEVVEAPTEVEYIPAKGILHPNCYCDHCLGSITGIRHKCLDCLNYDLCHQCLTLGVYKKEIFIENHDLNHTFGSIAFPGAEYDFIGAEEIEEEQERQRQQEEVTAREEEVRAVVVEEVVHPATCDICDKTIKGIRHKCINCPDFDACSVCHTEIQTTHPLHTFLPIVNSSLTPIKALPGSHTIHKNIICDGCNMSPIIGIRYKCMSKEKSCEDFDLCGNCESNPFGSHDSSHCFLKIREPLGGVDGKAVVGRGREFIGRSTTAPTTTTSSNTTSNNSNGNNLKEILLALGVESNTLNSNSILQSLGGTNLSIISQSITTNTSNGEKTLIVDLLDKSLKEGEIKEIKIDLPIVVTAVEEEEKDQVEAVEVAEVEVAEKKEEVSTTTNTNTNTTTIEESYFHSTFIKDITLKDGSLLPPGALFTKIWLIKNSGNTPWPIGTKLLNLDGFSSRFTIGSVLEVEVGVGEMLEVKCDLKAPEEGGSYSDGWRLQLPNGELFGNHLWVSIKVPNEESTHLNSTTAKELNEEEASSLSLSSSSSFIPPLINLKGKVETGSPTSSSISSKSTNEESDRNREDSVLSGTLTPSTGTGTGSEGFESVQIPILGSGSIGSVGKFDYEEVHHDDELVGVEGQEEEEEEEISSDEVTTSSSSSEDEISSDEISSSENEEEDDDEDDEEDDDGLNSRVEDKFNMLGENYDGMDSDDELESDEDWDV